MNKILVHVRLTTSVQVIDTHVNLFERVLKNDEVTFSYVHRHFEVRTEMNVPWWVPGEKLNFSQISVMAKEKTSYSLKRVTITEVPGNKKILLCDKWILCEFFVNDKNLSRNEIIKIMKWKQSQSRSVHIPLQYTRWVQSTEDRVVMCIWHMAWVRTISRRRAGKKKIKNS